MIARRWIGPLAAAYVLALHGALAIALLRPDAVWSRLRQILPGPAAETISEFRLWSRHQQSGLSLSARPGAVWIFGDSIVQGMDTGRIDPRAINLGIGGDTVRGVSDRVGDHSALSGAAGIVLAAGINDLYYREPPEIARDYETLLTRLPPGVPIVVSAVLPVDERARRAMPATRNDEIRRLNAAIAVACAAREACVFVEPGRSMVDESGRLAPGMHRGDGLHPGRAGYDRMIEALAAPVRDRMPPRDRR